jgi:hypothetical protein
VVQVAKLLDSMKSQAAANVSRIDPQRPRRTK